MAVEGHADGARQGQIHGGDSVEIDDLRVGDAHEAQGIELLLQFVQPQPDGVGVLRGLGADPLALCVEAEEIALLDEIGALLLPDLKGAEGEGGELVGQLAQLGCLLRGVNDQFGLCEGGVDADLNFHRKHLLWGMIL